MSKGRAMKVGFSYFTICFLAAALIGCAPAANLDTGEHQTLDSLPAGMREVVQNESPAEQQKFLSMPAEKRDRIVREWQRREQMIQTFTPAERMVISSLPSSDQDKFFLLSKDKEEPFLAEKAKVNHEALVNCLTLTHRRFGEYITAGDRESASQRFTLTEQAVISGLSQEDSNRFFALPADQQEQFLADTVRGNTEQLIGCMTQSHRHLGDAP
jgi:hypothetical protein